MHMTEGGAAALARARRARRDEERRERARILLTVLAALLALAAFAAAGTEDLADRTRGLGASMMPDPAWLAGEVG